MDKLQYGNLANLAIDGVAIRALLCFATLFVYFLEDLGALQVIDAWLS